MREGGRVEGREEKGGGGERGRDKGRGRERQGREGDFLMLRMRLTQLLGGILC